MAVPNLLNDFGAFQIWDFWTKGAQLVRVYTDIPKLKINLKSETLLVPMNTDKGY